MKKVFITIIAFLALSSTVMAAGHVDSVRYLTTKAWKNWYISASGTVNWWQGSMRTPEGYDRSYTAVEWGKPTFGFNVYVGKWINHKVGVRLGYSNTRINSYVFGLNPSSTWMNFLYDGTFNYVRDENGNFVLDENGKVQFLSYDGEDPVEGNIYSTSMRYHRLQGDFMISPIDFFQGFYNENRIWTPVLYVSMGAAHTSGSFFALKTLIDNGRAKKEHSDNPELYKSGSNFELALGAGLSNNFRLGKHFDLNLDLGWTFQRWTIDSWAHEMGGVDNNAFSSGPRPKQFDNMYTASLGLIYYFTREYDLPVNCCDEMDSLRKKLDEFMNMPVVPQEPCDTIVKFVNVQTEDMVSYPFSIFFNRDSYQLMSRRDLVNLREIANVAKENGYKLRLRGSCDSATATPAYNQTLSENRCRKIMNELMEMGIPESQIILVPMGGVKELDPTEYDRRVLIELIKEAPKD